MGVDGGGQQPRWAERWMASRASFDTNRSSIRGAAAAMPGRASMDHQEPVKTLEMDTAWLPLRQAPEAAAAGWGPAFFCFFNRFVGACNPLTRLYKSISRDGLCHDPPLQIHI